MIADSLIDPVTGLIRGKNIRIPDEQRLLMKLLHNYDTAARPVFNASHTVTVKFGLTLTQIADMVCVCHILYISDKPGGLRAK